MKSVLTPLFTSFFVCDFTFAAPRIDHTAHATSAYGATLTLALTCKNFIRDDAPLCAGSSFVIVNILGAAKELADKTTEKDDLKFNAVGAAAATVFFVMQW